jgi:hypothetical protein
VQDIGARLDAEHGLVELDLAARVGAQRLD